MNETPPRPFPMMGKITSYTGTTPTRPPTKNGICTMLPASASYAVPRPAPATATPNIPSPPLVWKITSMMGEATISTTNTTITWPVISSVSTTAAPSFCSPTPSAAWFPASPTRPIAPRSRATRSMAPTVTTPTVRERWGRQRATPGSTTTR